MVNMKKVMIFFKCDISRKHKMELYILRLNDLSDFNEINILSGEKWKKKNQI